MKTAGPKADRIEIFIKEYLIDFNATRAAKAAGYSEKTASEQAYDLLRKPQVQAALSEAIEKRSKRLDLKGDRVLLEVARVAFATLKDTAKWDANGVKLKSSDDLSDDVAAAVAEIRQDDTKDGRQVKIKMHDKIRALELAGRHLGLWKDSLDLTLGVKPIIIRRKSDGSTIELKHIREEREDNE